MSETKVESPVRWWSCLLGHRWSQWGTPSLATHRGYYGHPTEQWATQHRRCVVCGCGQSRRWRCA